VQKLFARKRAERETRIAQLAADAGKAGRSSERILAAIVYDAEHAPFSTNRAQLAEIGVEVPRAAPGAAGALDGLGGLDPRSVHETLWRIIYGLSYLGIFLCGTDHLDDRSLLKVLCTRILEETVRDVPPSADMSEFIDLTPCRAETADGLEGPFDSSKDELDDVDEAPLRGHGRDRLLPRPRREVGMTP
jgi:hypothetical protein